MSAAPTLYVFASQSSVPDRQVLGFFPAPTVKQKDAFTPEYSPAPSQSKHSAPEGEYFEATQSLQALVEESKYSPPKHELHDDEPTKE